MCLLCFGIIYLAVLVSNICLIKEVNMKKNMGNTDRVIRLIIAAVIGVLYYTGTISGTLGIVLLVLAGVFVLTSFVSFCPLYAPFGISTCSTKDS